MYLHHNKCMTIYFELYKRNPPFWLKIRNLSKSYVFFTFYFHQTGIFVNRTNIYQYCQFLVSFISFVFGDGYFQNGDCNIRYRFFGKQRSWKQNWHPFWSKTLGCQQFETEWNFVVDTPVNIETIHDLRRYDKPHWACKINSSQIILAFKL